MNYDHEPLEDPKQYRYFINPDQKNLIFKAYKTAQENFWVEEDIDSELKKDSMQWKEVDPKIQDLIKHQVAFFLIGDGRVNQTISEHIDSRITDREVQTWYNFQKMMEDIHNITYVKLADTYIKDLNERKIIFNAVENYPVINRKINWIKKWLNEDNDVCKLSDDSIEALNELKSLYKDFKKTATKHGFVNNNDKSSKIKNLFRKLKQGKPQLAKQIFINLITEGLFFQGSFCLIFWCNHQHGILPGLTKSNEFISRDEGMHTDFGILLYMTRIKKRLTQQEAHQIMSEAVDIEIDFMSEALPSGLTNMNIELLTEYIKFVADTLLVNTGYEKLYNKKNPFKFMDKQSVSVRITDFFIDSSVSEYGIFASNTNYEDKELNFDDDFE